MNCKEMKEYVDDYILGELDSEIEIQLNEHAVGCEQCQREIAEKEKVIKLFEGSQRFEPPTEMYRRISSRFVLSKKEKKILWKIPRNLVYVMAAFCLGVLLMRTVDVLVLRGEESPQVEMRYESTPKGLISDTIQFYSVPAKNLVEISRK